MDRIITKQGIPVTRALVTCDTLWGLVCLAAFVVLCNSHLASKKRHKTGLYFDVTGGGELKDFGCVLIQST